MILDIPPTTAHLVVSVAQKKGITVDELLLQTFADDEQAYYDWFYQHHFDIEKLDKSIKSGSAPVPHFDSAEQLANWLGGVR